MSKMNVNIIADGWKSDDSNCPSCRVALVFYRIVESSCGGYEDVNYHCGSCGKNWWIDGIDS